MSLKNSFQFKIALYAFILLLIILAIFGLNSGIKVLKAKQTEKVPIPENYTGCDHVKYANAPIEPKDILKDPNVEQLIHAQKNGLKKPFKTNQEFDSLIGGLVKNYTLVEMKDCRLYHLKSLKHSHPYLIPEAVCMVDEIAIRFQQKLKEKKLGNYCFFLTSLLRTEETQEKLSSRNGNAIDSTAHYYGTTVDISYKHFYNLDTDSVVPSWEVIQELTKTLLEMRKECKLMAVRERKQSCFHITVVVCKPKEQRTTTAFRLDPAIKPKSLTLN